MMCEDRVAIVTGAAGSGMGRSIALTLAREGAKVVVNYRKSKRNAEEIVRHMASDGNEGLAVQADVFEFDGCKQLVDATIDKYGQVDICIVSPGAGWHDDPIHKLNVSGAIEDVHHEVAPVFSFMALVLPGMFGRKWGRFIAISLNGFGSPSYAYNVAKAARTHAMKIGVAQAWQKGVTLNIIAPGPVGGIKTLTDAIEQCEHGPAWTGRKNVSPQDIAEGVAFLCSEAGRFVSGCELTYRWH